MWHRQGKSKEGVGETKRESRNKAKEERKIQRKRRTLAGRGRNKKPIRYSKGRTEQ